MNTKEKNKLNAYVEQLSSHSIPAKRLHLLDSISEALWSVYKEADRLDLTFICTHNSRRSQMSQIWAQYICQALGISNIQSYSGGTEATAFNPRAIAALERSGFEISIYDSTTSNIKYFVEDLSPNGDPYIMDSKIYNDTITNPKEDFVAIMTCDHADKNCPFVAGSKKRISWSFVDPKISDGTSTESQTYDERCLQIAQEIYYVLSKLTTY